MKLSTLLFLAGASAASAATVTPRPPVPVDCPQGSQDGCCDMMEKLNAGTASSDSACNAALLLPARVDLTTGTPTAFNPLAAADLATMCAANTGCIAATRDAIKQTLKDARANKKTAGCRGLKAFDDVLEGYCLRADPTNSSSDFCFPKASDSFTAYDNIMTIKAGKTNTQPDATVCADKCHPKNYAMLSQSVPQIALSQAQETAQGALTGTPTVEQLRAALDSGADTVKDVVGQLAGAMFNVALLSDSVCMTDKTGAYCWPKLANGADALFSNAIKDPAGACADECTTKALTTFAAVQQQLALQMGEQLQDRIGMINPPDGAKAQAMLQALQGTFTTTATAPKASASGKTLDDKIAGLVSKVPADFQPVFNDLTAAAGGAAKLAQQVAQMNVKADIMDAIASRGCGTNSQGKTCVSLAAVPTDTFNVSSARRLDLVSDLKNTAVTAMVSDMTSMMGGMLTSTLGNVMGSMPTDAFQPPAVQTSLLGSKIGALGTGASLTDTKAAACDDLKAAIQDDGCCADMVLRVKNAQLAGDAQLNAAYDKMTGTVQYVGQQLNNAQEALKQRAMTQNKGAKDVLQSVVSDTKLVQAMFNGVMSQQDSMLAQVQQFKSIMEQQMTNANSNANSNTNGNTNANTNNAAGSSGTTTTTTDMSGMLQQMQTMQQKIEGMTSLTPKDLGKTMGDMMGTVGSFMGQMNGGASGSVSGGASTQGSMGSMGMDMGGMMNGGSTRGGRRLQDTMATTTVTMTQGGSVTTTTDLSSMFASFMNDVKTANFTMKPDVAPSPQSALYLGVSDMMNAALTNPIGVCQVKTDAKCSAGKQLVTKTTKAIKNVDCAKLKSNMQLASSLITSMGISYARDTGMSPADVDVSICGIDQASLALASFSTTMASSMTTTVSSSTSSSVSTSNTNPRRLAATTASTGAVVEVVATGKPSKPAGATANSLITSAISGALADNADSLGTVAENPDAAVEADDDEAVETEAEVEEAAGAAASDDEVKANAVVDVTDDANSDEDMVVKISAEVDDGTTTTTTTKAVKGDVSGGVRVGVAMVAAAAVGMMM